MLNRRQTLQALTALWPASAAAAGLKQPSAPRFRHGVASGDPTLDSLARSIHE